MNTTSQHTFHIPVMGLAFTIDSPVKVARYGIASVISIVEDRLIETMRNYYYPLTGKPCQPISVKEDDYRAKRITDYLDLVNTIVTGQVASIRKAAFEAGSEIVKYFEMLPERSAVKQLYRQMMKTGNPQEKEKLASSLRAQVIPGSIDVNLMTKLDKNNFGPDGQLLENGSDAVAALRGYVNSTLENSSVVFSAGLNPRLYNYLEKCRQFDADSEGIFKKKVIIKVSDYRSALVQGKYLAKKGIWVSEFRIESGLNCGGHAFATDGFLMGPILEEFRNKKQELSAAMFEIYNAALVKRGAAVLQQAPLLKIAAQGGIGTAEEDDFLHHYYGIESTGWGSPFLLVPEATTVDQPTLDLLCAAKKEDIILSNNSPLGVRFHYLKGSSAEKLKTRRLQNGHPGSPCTEKHLVSDTEFTTEPICTASHKYQKLKMAQLQALQLPEKEYLQKLAAITDKECLCVGLSNAAADRYNTLFIKGRKEVNICPGPNIAWFSKEVSLQSMVDHIYGRSSVMTANQRPNMFIAELDLYINFLKEALGNDTVADPKKGKYFQAFFYNLEEGIGYYQQLEGVAAGGQEAFQLALRRARLQLAEMQAVYNERFTVTTP